MLLFKKPVERINKSVWLILMAVLMQGIISSCHRDDEILPQTNPQVSAQLTTTKLGKKLKNPYSVENMQKALDMMLKETREVQSQRAEAFGQAAQQIKIEKTDLYVRFLPKDSAELELIQEDTLLQLMTTRWTMKLSRKAMFTTTPTCPKTKLHGNIPL